jgi:hypothetical protein
MTKGSGDTSSSEHDNVQGHDAQWPQRNSSSQLPTTSHTTSSAYDPVHDPDDEAGYGLHGISRSHQGAPSGRLQSSSDTHMQNLGVNQPRQQDGSYGYENPSFNNVIQGQQSQQETNQGYLDILDPFNGFDIPFWFEQDQHWDVFQNFS